MLLFIFISLSDSKDFWCISEAGSNEVKKGEYLLEVHVAKRGSSYKNDNSTREIRLGAYVNGTTSSIYMIVCVAPQSRVL